MLIGIVELPCGCRLYTVAMRVGKLLIILDEFIVRGPRCKDNHN